MTQNSEDLVQRAAENVQYHMDEILKNFKGEPNITLFVRVPGNHERDFCLSNDDLEEVAAMVQRTIRRRSDQAKSDISAE